MKVILPADSESYTIFDDEANMMDFQMKREEFNTNTDKMVANWHKINEK